MSFVAPRPLEGILVLDLSRETAGPFATMLMADMGAVVIKVEEPEQGDPSRWLGPPFYRGESPSYLALNRNKRSLAVSLESAEGAQLVRRLAREATVLIEDFGPGVADRLGLGYAELSAENPGLVYVSVTGYGQTGPERESPWSDLLVQAMGGVMSLTGPADGQPTRVGVPQADLVAGLLTVQGTLLALLSRQRNDKGQQVDVSALDGQVSLLTAAAAAWTCTGQAPARSGNQHPGRVPNGIYQASDGLLAVAVENDMQWGSLCEQLGKADMATDIRFAAMANRLSRREDVERELSPLFGGATVEQWVKKLREAGVPAAPVLDVPQVLEHPQVQAREMMADVEHPYLGSLRLVAHPVKLSATPARYEMGPPLLGEHSVEVLRAVLAMKDEEVDDLLERQVIAQHGGFESTEEEEIPEELTVSQEFALDIEHASTEDEPMVKRPQGEPAATSPEPAPAPGVSPDAAPVAEERQPAPAAEAAPAQPGDQPPSSPS